MENVQIKNLIVDYNTYNIDNEIINKKRAINNLSLEIKEGDFVSILGANGCGKSTLARCLNGLITPISGDVLIYGLNTKDETKIIDIRKLVGMTFQNPDNQIVASLVEEDIAFGLENLGVEPLEIRKRIDEAMKTLGIYELKDAVTSKLSGGQKQKVSIAGILAMKSKIIVLDEPTSMIDKNGRDELLKMALKLNRENNITIILISHFVEEILYSNRTIVMHDGSIVLDDIPKNILLKRKELNELGIDLPLIPRLASDLKKFGFNHKGNETTIEELCQYLK